VSPPKTAPWPGSVTWWGPFLNSSGYGEEARGFLRGLARRGLAVAARSSGDESSNFVELLEESPALAVAIHSALNRPVEPGPAGAVLHMPGWAMHPVLNAAFTVGRTMFETDGLPPLWAEQINLLDEVWVPASFNVETFTAAGVRAPLEVVPSGVDASLYRPGLRPLRLPGARGCTFLAVFEWSHRKAPDVLLKAWGEAFAPGDDVSLVLRCYSRACFDGDSTAEVTALVDRELAAVGRTRAEVAPIVVLGRQLSAAAMPRLLCSADVFVGVSRGEGWGRPLLEAMACGLPAIGTRWGGNVDFMDDDNSLLVDVDGLVPVDERMDIGFYRGQRWAEPSAQHLASLLQQAARDAGLRRRLGKAARSDVERRWQWQQVAAVVERRLRALFGAHSAQCGGAPGRAGLPGAPWSGAPNVLWTGDVFADHSLATVNRELLSRLARADDVTVQAATSERPPFPAEYIEALSNVAGAGKPAPAGGSSAVEVRHRWPPDFSPSTAKRLVVVQPWEFGGAPASWIGPMAGRDVDEIWVPTTWVKDCYAESGIPADKIAVVPNGVDTDMFSPEGPSLPLANDRSVRLLFVGGTIDRKGFDLLLDAYLATFGRGDDVCLVVKPFGADGAYRDSNMDARIRAAIGDPANPAVELVERRLSRAEMAMLYRACDVVVHPYRGEGFGLPVAEAMACGLPALITGYGACLDFCDATTGWLIDACRAGVRLPAVEPGPAGFWWAQPDPWHLQELMREAVSSADERRRLGEAARRRIAGSFTWEHAAEQARKRLTELAASAAGPPKKVSVSLPR
jgi:glycosyltransferase involved in cell wall biosynthesis